MSHACVSLQCLAQNWVNNRLEVTNVLFPISTLVAVPSWRSTLRGIGNSWLDSTKQNCRSLISDVCSESSSESSNMQVICFYISLLLLLLSHFSHADSVWPHRRQPTRLSCPWDSPGKNTGVGCHFLLQCMKVKKWKWSRSVVSDPQRPHGLQPTSFLHPWDFPGKSTGVGCHCLLLTSH